MQPSRIAALRRRRLEDEQRAGTAQSDRPANESTSDYDPFGLLEEHGAHVDSNGNTAQGKPINAHAVDTDPQGGLHTTGLKTEGLATGGLQGGPTPVGTGPSVARVGTPQPAQTNVVVQGGGSGARTHAAPVGNFPAPPSSGGAGGAGSAISDGSLYYGVPAKGADGSQTGWQWATPAEANWQANFGHLPGTASHPTQPAPVRSTPPSIPVRIASGAGVEGTGLPHSVAVELDQAQRNGSGTHFALPPGGFGKTWQGQPNAAPVVPVTHDANGTPVTSGLATSGAYGGALQELAGANLTGPIRPLSSATNTAAPATPAPPIAQTPTLPTPSFPGIPKPQPAAPPPLPAGTAAAQTPTAPAFTLATGAPTAASTPSAFQASTTIPASTVAGSTVTANDIRTPQPLTGEAAAIARNANLGRTPAPVATSRAPSVPLGEEDAIARNNHLGQARPTVANPAVVASPLPSEPGGSTAGTTAPQFPKPPTSADNPFAVPKPLTLASTAPVPTVPVAPTVDPEELKRRLAGR